ncbi:MAG: exopolysaccharide biosynthesis polyprenyl glycosylphosphotransferase [Duncaniella sp.]|nr:exopolysaccharide biosynthesis polyprenyl glycosylphosphotransferase [Duncaniella sp.]
MKEQTPVRRLLSYLLADYFTTLLGVLVFEIIRYAVVPGLTERYPTFFLFICSWGVKATFAFFPLMMLFLYYVSGYYITLTDKSRVNEFLQTFVSIFVGCFIFFMVVLLNDILPRRRYNYEIFLLLFVCIFLFVYPARLCLTTLYKHHSSILGRKKKALLVTFRDIGGNELRMLHFAAGQLKIDIEAVEKLSPEEGIELSALADRIRGGETECFIYDVPKDEDVAFRTLGELLRFNLPVFVQPSPSRVVLGVVRYNSVTTDPLVDVAKITLPDSQVAIKRTMDVIVSALGLVLTLPLTLVLAAGVRLSSRGPVFYKQERLGYQRRPFTLYKFRSMIEESEPTGPRLTDDEDPRITSLGKIMRRYRLDEIPNLWNVLKGDMSLVGPRPERAFFVERIMKVAPHYSLIHQVRPGVTSWGMVKFGYASNVDQMVERLTYDLLYVQNLSLSLDLKILFYTLRTLLRGEGK